MRSAVHRKEKIEWVERRGRGERSSPKEEGGQGLEKLLPEGQEEQQKAAEAGGRGDTVRYRERKRER